MPPELTYIKISDSAKYNEDLLAALARGDTRFVGIMGYSLEVPGVPDYVEKYDKTYGVKIIKGTSDSYSDSSGLSQSVFFRDYAEGYNKLLLNHIKSGK
jgi:hypothetical protein